MKRQARPRTLEIAIIIASVLIILESTYLISMPNINQHQTTQTTGGKTGASTISGSIISQDMSIARLCVNAPPQITYDCNYTTIQVIGNKTIYCQFNASDANMDNITFSSKFFTTPIIFNITSNGTVNFTAPPSAQNQINMFRIYVTDNSGCDNNMTYKDYNLTVDYNNHPPYLIKNISDEQIMQDHYYSFYLNDYFADPDGDQLSYVYVMSSVPTISIDITGDLVTVKGTACGLSTVYYVAIDYGGLTANSNFVNYNVTCPPQATPNSLGSQSAGTSGAGTGLFDYNCVPHWICSAWGPCKSDNTSVMNCMDYGVCNANDYQNYLLRNCTYAIPTYCSERWQCGAWGACDNNTQARACLDMNSCGTNTSMPSISQDCSALSSCYDGIKDNGETGVDCGGPCSPCKNVEQPTPITSPLTTTMIAMGITVSIAAALAFMFRSKIFSYLSKSMPNVRPARKAYITEKQKQRLLQLINIAQSRIDDGDVDHAMDQVSVFAYEYFRQLLSMDKITKSDLVNNVVKLKDKNLEKILVVFYAKLASITGRYNSTLGKKTDISLEELQALCDEMTHNTHIIGGFSSTDAANAVKYRPVIENHSIASIYAKLSNVYIALNFSESWAARSTYKEALEAYNTLPEDKKKMIYNDLIRSYNAIQYIERVLRSSGK